MIDTFVSDLIYVLFVLWISLAACAFVLIALAFAVVRRIRGREDGDVG